MAFVDFETYLENQRKIAKALKKTFPDNIVTLRVSGNKFSTREVKSWGEDKQTPNERRVTVEFVSPANKKTRQSTRGQLNTHSPESVLKGLRRSDKNRVLKENPKIRKLLNPSS